jgi:ABC-type uncharacterized transport system YnjBCD substrate-binding protein
MAAAYIESGDTANARVKQALRAIREGRAILGQEIAAAVQKRDGDGSLAAHYDLYATKMGYVANDYATADAAAKAGFDELSSLHFKLTTNAQVTDVATAIDQACAKFGV